MVQHRRVSQRRLDLVLNAVELLSAVAHEVDQRPHRQRRAQDVGYHLAYPRIGHKLLLDQIGTERAKARSILLRGAHARWRRGRRHSPTRWAAHMQDTVFTDLQPQRRELAHLPPLDPARRIGGQLVLADAALARPVGLDRVGRRHQRHLMPPMARLPAALLATLLAQTLGLASQPVAGWRLTAIVAILRQTGFQFLHAFQQRLHLFAQGRVLRSQRGLFFWRHAPSLPASASPS
jgi:hypothetical protein